MRAAAGVVLPPSVEVALLALAWSGAAGLLGLLALSVLPRRSVRTDLAAVATVAVASLVAGLTGAARAMFLSEHDFAVVVQIALVATPIALGVAVVAGRTVVGDVSRLRRRAASLTVTDAPPRAEPDLRRPRLAELARIDDDLVGTADRLVRDARARDALERSRRELVAWVSHDLRTPIAAIRATAEAIEDGVAADPADYLRRILREADRLGVLVDDLFELSRIQAGALTLAPTTVDLAELAHGAVDGAAPAARRRGVRLEVAPLRRTPVRADPGTLSRALSNLVVNAVHYSPPGGHVRVDVVTYAASNAEMMENSAASLGLNGAASAAVRPWRAQAMICHWLTRST